MERLPQGLLFLKNSQPSNKQVIKPVRKPAIQQASQQTSQQASHPRSKPVNKSASQPSNPTSNSLRGVGGRRAPAGRGCGGARGGAATATAAAAASPEPWNLGGALVPSAHAGTKYPVRGIPHFDNWCSLSQPGTTTMFRGCFLNLDMRSGFLHSSWIYFLFLELACRH